MKTEYDIMFHTMPVENCTVLDLLYLEPTSLFWEVRAREAIGTQVLMM